ncbi:hypothetical protein TESG_03976, partial [Trichophyton tonsurans CBS 112818]
MAGSFLSGDESQGLDPWNDFQYAPTPGYLGEICTPSVCSPPDQVLVERFNTPAQAQTGQLGFIPLANWNKEEAYDEQPPTYIHYLIDWKVTLNNRTISRVTEPNLVVTPSAYWQNVLEEKVKKVKCRKVFQNRRARLDGISIVTSVVNDRSQQDLHQQFETDIDWIAIEKQLLVWGALLLRGKKLRLDISINYIAGDTALSRKGNKRGTGSVTKTMLAEQDAQIDAECSSGGPSVWRDVYKKMHCPGPPCQNSEGYCWQDPVGKKHYRLRTHHLKSLVKFVEEGNDLETQGDVPDVIQEQLYREEQQWLERQRKNNRQSKAG